MWELVIIFPHDFVRPQLEDLGILSEEGSENLHVEVQALQRDIEALRSGMVLSYIDSVHLDWDEEDDVNTWVVTHSVVGTEHEVPLQAWVCPDQSVGVQMLTDVVESSRDYDNRYFFVGLMCNWIAHENSDTLGTCDGFVADRCMTDTTDIFSVSCETSANITNASSAWHTTKD